MTKTLKKTLAIVVALALCLSAFMGCFSVSAADTDTITATVTGSTVTEGAEEVTVTIDIASTGFAAALLDISFGGLDIKADDDGEPAIAVTSTSDAGYDAEAGTWASKIVYQHNSFVDGVANVSAANDTNDGIRLIIDGPEEEYADAQLVLTFVTPAVGEYTVAISELEAADYGTYENNAWTNTEDIIETVTINQAEKNVVVNAAHVHEYSKVNYDETGHWTECTCGEKTKVVAHTMGDWADGARACTAECGYTETCEHTSTKLSYSAKGHYTVCDTCGIVGETTSHTMGDWTDGTRACTAECGYSENCEHTTTTLKYTDATGHWAECDTCGHKAETVAHTMGDWADGTRACTAQCGYTETCEHVWEYSYEWVDDNSQRGLCVTTRTCTNCSDTETVSSLTNFAIYKAPVLESGLAINFRILQTVVSSYTDIYAVIEKEIYEGNTLVTPAKTTVFPIVDNYTTYWTFNYTGISAKEMCNNINVKIYGTNSDGIVVLAGTCDYSFVKYLNDKYTEDNLTGKAAAERQLVVDLAVYGAAAQDYFGYHTDVKPTDNIPLTFASQTPTEFDQTNVSMEGGVTIYKAPILGNAITIALRFKKNAVAQYGENLSFVVDYVTTSGASDSITVPYSDFETFTQSGTEYWSITFDKFTAATLSQQFTSKIMSGDTVIGQNKYTIERYAYNEYAEDPTSKDTKLCQAMIAYGYSADAYFNYDK